ncbi:MAG: transcriptional regulator, partial [Micromonosporaceae bacterium]|nr:transcriptional regulator [Micromonosporaceae bacterium]
ANPRRGAEAARRAAAAGEPVRVVELAGVRSPDAVPGTVAAALHGGELTFPRPSSVDGPQRTDGADPVRRAARDLVGLVVLDNCEHVLDAAAESVGQILAVAPRATVLVTSRAPLGLAGEAVYRLRALADDDALALLESRARAGGATLPWSREQALSLCHRLDNLPLALELAAARLRHMSIDEVLAGLADRFGLLDEALRGLPERHASLWAMVDWSHDLLPPEVRRLWWRLSVIPAPFTVDTAIGVAGTVPEVRAGLATLVDQSLLTLDRGDDGAPRYRMLETVREYGDVRLAAESAGPAGDGGGRAAAMAGLVAWAAARAAELAPDLLGARQVTTLARLAADADTLAAALRWSITTGDEVSAVDIARVLFHLWMVQGRHGDVLDWSVPLLRVDDPAARRESTIVNGSAAGERNQPLPNAENLAWTLLLIGGNVTVAGVGMARIVAVCRRALRRLFAERGADLSPRIAALAWLPTSVDIANLETSRPIVERLVGHDDPLVQGFGLFLSSVVWASVGDDERALADNLAAYERFAAVGDQWMMGLTAQGVATRLAAAGRPGGQEWLRRGAAHLAVVGATEDAQSLQVQLDAQLALAGDEQAAKRLAAAATDPATEPMNVVIAGIGLAEIAIRHGRYDEALAHIDAVARSGPAWPPGQGLVTARSAAAILRLWAADIAPSPTDAIAADQFAVAQLQAARADALSIGDLPTLSAWALAGAELAAHRGRDDIARDLWAVAVRLGARMVYPFQEGHGSRLSRVLGDQQQREALLRPWRSSSVPAVTGRVRELMAELLDGHTLRR